MAEEDPIVFPIEVDASGADASARRAGDEVVEGIAAGIRSSPGWQRVQRELGSVAQQMARGISDGLGGGGGGRGGGPFKGFADGADEAARKAATLGEDVEALGRRIAAMRELMTQTGAPADLFAVIDVELRRVLERAQTFNDDLERISRDPDLLAGYKAAFEESGRVLSEEIRGIQSGLRNLAQTQSAAAQATIRADERVGRERLARIKADSSAFVVETQRAGAQVLAETRIAGQRQIQSERQTQRVRVELLRFTLAQVRQAERAIGAVFRGTGTLLAGVYSRVERVVVRFGQVLRRSNREINDGLNGALIQRERALSDSFRSQTETIRSEMTRQQRVMEDASRQMQRGPLGFLFGGRGISRVLGAGALIGGGMGFANLFSQGLDRFSTLERTNMQLTRMLGNAERARELLDSINDWAIGTPLALDAVSEIAVGLLSMGTAADSVIPRMQAITDAVAFTSGGADEINRVTLAIRQIASAGRLLGQDFNQLTQALPGLNLGQLLADQITGGDQRELLRLREAGEVSADQFIRAFVAGVEDDPRIAGATRQMGDLLTGQIANLNAAWRRLGEALVTQLEPFLRRSIANMTRNLSFLARFVRGDVSPALMVLRSAILGVGAAMGTLIAARAAVQVLQLLGLAARFALTPMGLLGIAVAGIGAAIAIALRHIPDLNLRLRRLASNIQDAAGRGFTQMTRAVERLVGVIRSRLIPLLDQARAVISRLIGEVRDRLAPVVERVGEIFSAVWPRALAIAVGAIGRLVALGSLLATQIVPAVIALATTIGSALLPRLQRLGQIAQDAFSAALRYLDPLIQGFAALGRAVAGIFGGGAGGGFGGLGAALRQIGSALGSIASDAGSALLGLLARIGAALSGFVENLVRSLPRIGVELGRALGVVAEAIGFALGRVVSDPRFAAALAAIAAAILAIAFQIGQGFVTGLIRGIRGGLREWRQVLAQEFGNSFSEVMRNIAGRVWRALFDPRVLLGALGVIAAASIGSALFRALRPSMTQAGGLSAQTYTQAFLARLRLGGPQSAMFGAALFGGMEGLANSARRFAQAEADALQRERFRAIQQMQSRGIPQLAGADPIQTIRNYEAAYGRAAFAAAGFRDQLVLAAQRGRQAITDLGVALSTRLPADLRTALSSATQFAGSFAQALRTAVRDAGAIARESGVAIGGFMLQGIGAALSGFAGGSAGGAMGTIGGIGGILASALAAQAQFASPVITAAVVAIGTAGFVLGQSGREAQAASERMNTYRDSILQAADATETLILLTRDLIAIIGRELSADAQRALIDAEFDATAFAEAIRAGASFEEAIRASTSATSDLNANLDDTLTRLDLIESQAGGIESVLSRAFDQIGIPTGPGPDAAAEAIQFLQGAADDLVRGGQLAELTQGLEDVAGAGERTELPLIQMGSAVERLDAVLATGGAPRSLRALSKAFEREFGAMERTSNDTLQRVIDFLQSSFGDLASAAIEALRGLLNLEDLPPQIGDIQRAIENLNAARIEPLTTQLVDLQEELRAAREEAQRARDALVALLTDNYADSAQEAVDNLIRGMQSAFRQMVGGVGLIDAGQTILGNLDIDAATREVQTFLAAVIQNLALNEGIQTPDAIRAELQRLGVFEAAAQIGRQAMGELAKAVDPAIARFAHLADNIKDVETAIKNLRDARTTELRAQVDLLTRDLNVAQEAAANARSALESFLTGDYGASARRQLDQFIVGLDGWRQRFEQITERISRDPLGLEGQAQQRVAMADFADEFGRVLSAAQQEGLIVDAASARAFFGPAFDVVQDMLAGATDRAMRQGIHRAGADIGEELADLAGILEETLGRADLTDAIQGAAGADALVANLQRQLDSARAQLDTELVFSEAQVAAELAKMRLPDLELEIDEDWLENVINEGIENADLGGALTDLVVSEDNLARIEAQVSAIQAEIKAEVVFDRDQILGALEELGFKPEMIELVNPALLEALRLGPHAAVIGPGAPPPQSEGDVRVEVTTEINQYGTQAQPITAADTQEGMQAAAAGLGRRIGMMGRQLRN